MQQFCYLVIANGVFASLLAISVWLVSRWVKSPGLLHLLWVLVLLRLVAPPLLAIDLAGSRAYFAQVFHRSSVAPAMVMREALGGRTQCLAAVTKAMGGSHIIPIRNVLPPAERVAIGETSRVSTFSGVFRFVAEQTILTLARISERSALILFPVWFVGSVICFAVHLRALWLFRRSVHREAYSSRVWQRRTEKVAKRMGLRTCPQLLLVRAQISPMLWGFGYRSRILFPEQLLESLSSRAQDTLLAHELGHYRRGDQWVRLLELLATTIYWWHPILWWTRQEIEKVEERCCDAWAVRQANGCPRTYAEALLATVDFVSASPLPPVASGAGGNSFLRQRLQAIMGPRLRRGRTLVPDSYPGVWALAALVLIPCPSFWSGSYSKPTLNPANAQVDWKTVGSGDGRIPTVLDQGVLDPPPLDSRFRLHISRGQRASFLNRANGIEVQLGVGVVSSASFSHEEDLLVIGTMSGQIQVLECETGVTVRRLDLSNVAVSSVAFSPDDQVLAVGTRGGLCRILDLQGLGAEEVVRRHVGASVRCVRFSRNGRFAAVLWNRRSGQLVEIWDLVSGRIQSTTPRGSGIVAVVDRGVGDLPAWHSIHDNGDVFVWKREGGNAVLLDRIPQEIVQQIRIPSSPNAQR